MPIIKRNKSALLQYFALFPENEILYITTNGVIFQEQDLEEVIGKIGTNNICAVTRADLDLPTLPSEISFYG